jgi:hypothetical protein
MEENAGIYELNLIRRNWVKLYEKYVGPYRSEGNDRAFKSFCGIDIMVAEKIFLDYQHILFLPDREKLMIVLHFLKTFDTEDNSTTLFQFGSRNTYRKYLWKTLQYLDIVMTEVKLENRFEDYYPLRDVPVFSRVTMIIDGTQCPLFCPRSKSKEEKQEYFSGRSKDNTHSRYNFNYTVGVHVKSGKIVYVGGPHKGSVHDLECVRREGLIGQIEF